MQEELEKMENDNKIISNDRKKRVKRLKIVIISIIIMLIVIPTILSIILGFQVIQLRRQVNQLMTNKEIALPQHTRDNKYAYAADKNTSKIEGSNKSVTLQTNEDIQLTDFINDSVTDIKYTSNPIEEFNIYDSRTDYLIETDFPNIELNDEENPIIENDSIHGIYHGKKVYLTFDDGPSIYTDDILDILEEYNVKATFFVVGQTDENSKRLYQRIVNEGHTLGMHSYSHIYHEIYKSLEDFDKDFTKLWKLLYDTTGYMPTVYRFPGGSGNNISKKNINQFIEYLNDKSIIYFDWNVLNKDATGTVYTKDQLIENVLSGVKTKKNAIVLLHDANSKKTTVNSLPRLLEELITQGAEILPLDETVTPVQQIKANSIN